MPTLRETPGMHADALDYIVDQQVNKPQDSSLPPPTTAARLHRVLHGGLVLLAFTSAAMYLYVAVSTLSYPYQLEWMEGGTMDVVSRVVDGEPVYTAPTVDYVPYIYAPLYYYVSAAVAHWTGVDFACARIVSFASTVIAALLLAVLVRHETQAWSYGWIAAGLFLAAFDATGRWYHVARVDSLYLCLLALGFACFRLKARAASAVAAGVIWTATVLTKQTALIVLFPLLGISLFHRTRHTLICAATLALCTIAGVLYLNHTSDGWFWTFAFTVPQGHGFRKSMLIRFWLNDLFAKIPVLLVLSVAGVALGRSIRPRGDRIALAALTACLIFSAWIGRLHRGGFVNVVIPAYYGLCLLATVGYHSLHERCRRPSALNVNGGGRPGGPRAWTILMATAALALVAQFGLLAYDPRAAIPTACDRQAGDEFLRKLATVDGDVLITGHRFIQTRCGKTSCGLGMAAQDVIRCDDRKLVDALTSSIQEAIERGRFVAIVDPLSVLRRYVEHPGEPFFDDPDVYFPVTGWQYRPERIHRVLPRYLRTGRR